MRLRRLFLLFKRRRYYKLVLMICVSFLLLYLLLYLCIVILFDQNLESLFATPLKDEILHLDGVEKVIFQDEEISINQNADVPKKTSPVPQFTATQNKTRQDLTLYKGEHNYKQYYHSHNSNYLLILGHYEQLGKTTINFMHAGLLTAWLNRKIVIPFVRNSRYCGLQEGWTGLPRKKTREFLPMENYFDMSHFVSIFKTNNFAEISSLNEFRYDCQQSDKNMIVYFVYEDAGAEVKKYMKMNHAEYESIILNVKKNNGWSDCSKFNQRIGISYRLQNLTFPKGLCIDPKVISTEEKLKELTFSSKCLIFFLWRGIGFKRTHFNLTLPYSHEIYLSEIKFSTLVKDEAQRFIKKHFHNKPYISIHIRSERQLLWYSVNKYKKCLDLMVKVLHVLSLKKQIKKVFLSSDITVHGSDFLKSSLNPSDYKEATSYLSDKIKAVKAVVYKANKNLGLIYRDSGFVALIEMEILANASHLITIGAGTFQGWLIALFKRYRKEMNHSWSLSRVCMTEMKINKESSEKNKNRNIK